MEEPSPRGLGYQERLRLYRKLTDIPITQIATRASSAARAAVLAPTRRERHSGDHGH